MGISHLLSGLIVLLIGVISYYFLIPKTEELTKRQIIIHQLLFPICSIFIGLGLLGILTFCFGIDGGYYTPEKNDDMTVLNGIALIVCMFSMERNLTYYLKKIKEYKNKK